LYSVAAGLLLSIPGVSTAFIPEGITCEYPLLPLFVVVLVPPLLEIEFEKR
jgi:hypothetical protein